MKEPIDLLHAAGMLKQTKRRGWIKRVGITKETESVADHSFRMAIIAMVFVSDQKIDSSKMVRMCLIHDLAESVIGDILPEEKLSKASHRKRENQVMNQIFSSLAPTCRAEFARDWKELLDSKTKEAKLVWEIDRAEMALQKKDYERLGYDKNALEVFSRNKFPHFGKMVKEY
ncbi:MAG: HD domain-containing protein [Nitrososphaerales archaeon]